MFVGVVRPHSRGHLCITGPNPPDPIEIVANTFFDTHAGLAEKRTFKRFIAALRRSHWVVHCKAPFAGPEQVLRYLSRYTHRVAISNRRLVAADNTSIAFRWKD